MTKEDKKVAAIFVGIVLVSALLAIPLANELERLPETAGEAWARFERAYEENK